MTPQDDGDDQSTGLPARDREPPLPFGRGGAGRKDALRRAAERFLEDAMEPPAAPAATPAAPAATPEVTMSRSESQSEDRARSSVSRFTDGDLLLFEEGVRRQLREHLDAFAELSGRLLGRLAEGASPAEGLMQELDDAHAWFADGADMVEAWTRILEEQGSRSPQRTP